LPAIPDAIPPFEPGPGRPQPVHATAGPRHSVRSSSAFSGAPAGITMRRPAIDCWNSYVRAVVGRPRQPQHAGSGVRPLMLSRAVSSASVAATAD
jgi:hypothetical protein